jgi:hypothetical protein
MSGVGSRPRTRARFELDRDSAFGHLDQVKSLQRVVSNYLAHYHQERNHQRKDNRLLLPVSAREASARDAIGCRERLGTLLNDYSRAA